MLAVSPPRGSRYGDDETDGDCADAFSTLDDFSDGAFLDDINFDDLSAGFDVDGGAVPDLDLDPGDIFADFSFLGGEEDDDANVTAQEAAPPPGVESSAGAQDRVLLTLEYRKDPGDTHEASRPAAEEHSIASEAGLTSSRGSGGGGKPPAAAAAAAKNSQGKKKGKVDWTPELHRRFVQAVEHLGVEKAVPSRILELMGIECLTRHNIASHLQKYRSHRKHALAREAEAGSCWVQRRPPTYAPRAAARSHANGAAHRWLAPPTIGFPPPPPPPVPPPPSRLPAPAVQNLRPLRVWGHPTGDLQQAPLVRGWPRHRLLAGPRGPPPAAPPPWAPPPPPPSAPDASYWRHHYHHRSWGVGEGWIPHAMTQGTPCFAQAPMPTAMLLAPPVPVPVPVTVQVAAAGIIPPVRRPALRPAMTQLCRPSSQLQFDAHPTTNESVDAAIEDVMSKPWLPMPLGLKPPSVDSVLRELQKQGVAEMPPTCTTATTT